MKSPEAGLLLKPEAWPTQEGLAMDIVGGGQKIARCAFSRVGRLGGHDRRCSV